METTIEKLHKTLKNIMKEVHDFCEKNHIDYYLAWGSLLGAVRHNDMIPWDDDLDIIMTRENHEKFCELWKKDPPKNLFLQNITTDKDVFFLYSKIRLNETTFEEKQTKRLNLHKGIFIDIFILDNLPKNEKKHKRFIKKRKILNRIYSNHILFKSTKNIKGFICQFIPKNLILKLCEKMIYKENSNKIFDSCCWSGYPKVAYEASWFENKKLVKFGEYEFYIPSGYDSILKNNFGNYMQLPPKEKQIPGHNEYIDFGKN